jgi:hypothetical protein
MKLVGVLAALALVAIGFGQAPDVRIKLDTTLSYRTENGGSTGLRLYGSDGRFSTISLILTMDTGLRAFVSERLQRIQGNADRDFLDEYYVEDPGIWRIGKQLLPFGSTRVIHESVPGARADTNLIFQGMPVSMVLFDAGAGLQRGFVARIGSRIGLSVFSGDHFGIDATSFTQFREPEDSPGIGRGYKRSLAIDGEKRFSKIDLRGEFVAMNDGETPLDKDFELADGSVTYSANRIVNVTAGYSWVAPSGEQFIRFSGEFGVTKGVTFEPMIRFRDGGLRDISLQLRVRL